MKSGRMLSYLFVVVLIGFAYSAAVETKPIRIGIVTRYAPVEVNPPAGVRSEDRIRSGSKR